MPDRVRGASFFPSALLALGVLLAAAAAAAQPPITLQLPLRCNPGADCWISNHVDLAPGPEILDYACGRFTYDDHNGIDFALRDHGAMAEGVAVVAAAPGAVAATRDGVADVSVRDRDPAAIEGRECGNGVRIDHGGGWQTQYCHLRSGSIAVRRGETVAAGQVLGMVGLSGKTEYPHLHFTVRHERKVVDPFRGQAESERCGIGEQTLWRTDAARALPYAPAAVYNFGVAPRILPVAEARSGRFRSRMLAHDAPAVVIWLEAFGVSAGDVLNVAVNAPDSTPFLRHRSTFERNQARIYRAVGRRIGRQPWPPGVYQVRISITRSQTAAPASSSVSYPFEIR
jgi:murein DD-endopeptidase MepM/ murein hydrolase activator NlpD